MSTDLDGHQGPYPRYPQASPRRCCPNLEPRGKGVQLQLQHPGQPPRNDQRSEDFVTRVHKPAQLPHLTPSHDLQGEVALQGFQ